MRRLCALLAVFAVVAYLSGCGTDIPAAHDRVVVAAPIHPTVRAASRPKVKAFFAVLYRRDVKKLVDIHLVGEVAEWNGAVRANTIRAEAARRAASVDRSVMKTRPDPASTSVPSYVPTGDLSSTQGVRDCIKSYESGNPAEASHPEAGSGAYQFIPGTWRHWSAQAGHPGYAYAYQAPGAVQDAVAHYTLTHGGAGNWSMRFGVDPCTGN